MAPNACPLFIQDNIQSSATNLWHVFVLFPKGHVRESGVQVPVSLLEPGRVYAVGFHTIQWIPIPTVPPDTTFWGPDWNIFYIIINNIYICIYTVDLSLSLGQPPVAVWDRRLSDRIAGCFGGLCPCLRDAYSPCLGSIEHTGWVPHRSPGLRGSDSPLQKCKLCLLYVIVIYIYIYIINSSVLLYIVMLCLLLCSFLS